MDPSSSPPRRPRGDRTSDATWRMVDRLFAGALELAPEERRSWLETSAPEPWLADEVMRLLREAEATGLPLESRDDGRLRGLWEGLGHEPGGDPLVGSLLGSYRLVRPLGTGGMGTVYLAERKGGEFEHRVAIKVLRPGVHGAEALARFRAERSILATLDHPEIATLFDGGTAPDGRPYIVMEHVEGVPITEHVRRTRPGLHETLRLFLTVVGAVEHAHRHLVVHRDLKPSNILVRDDGVVKLVDFGIARLLDEERADHTATGSRVMTPAYAAPEQFLGEPVTTATDVYQLGAVLHELLTGEQVIRAGCDPREMAERILERTPERPSLLRRREPPSGAHVPPGRFGADLDTIVLTALRKEPERRYGSAGALGDDLRRFLARRPIAARPDTFGYRLRTALRRHPWVGPATAAALLVLVVYVGTLIRHTRSLERERAISDQVESFLVDLLQPADPRRTDGATLTARDLVAAGAERLDRDLGDQPEVQARLASVMGEAFTALSDFPSALEVYELRLDAVRRSAGEGSEPYASALTDLGVARANAGEQGAADSLLTEALELRRRLHGPEHALVGWTLLQRARLRAGVDVEGANADYDAWLPIFRASPPEPTPDYLESMATFVWIRLAQGRADEAVTVAKEALALARSRFAETNPLVAEQHDLLASAFAGALRWEESVAAASLAVAGLEAAHDPSGSLPLADAMATLALSLERSDRPDSAATVYERVIELYEGMGRGDDVGLLIPYQGIARHLAGEGSYEEAEGMMERALEIAVAAVGGPSAVSGSVQVRLAAIQEERGDTAAAEATYRSGVAALEGSSMDRAVELRGRRRLAALARMNGRFADAAEQLQRAEAIAAASVPSDHAEVLRELVEVFEAWERPERAEAYRVRLAELDPSGS